MELGTGNKRINTNATSSASSRPSAWSFNGEAYSGPHTDSLRKGFIRKVYGILSAQLLLTVMISVFMSSSATMRTAVIASGSAIIWTVLIVALVILIALHQYKTVHPTNLYLLFAFTAVESVSIGLVCAMFTENGMGYLVLQAAMITTSIFVGLTLFTFQSRIDFSFLGAGLFAGLWIIVIWGLFSLVFGSGGGFIYSVFGALLFSGFILFDTWRITSVYGYDDYVVACIDLYLDILNLFLHILRILAIFAKKN